ncbi:hypothetical protein [Aquisphaera insulae]|uniref:hypothetical protein n=1 Tax=Aquisphaera insulae TaxID=2712864 RepID=UPI0013EDC747|nr:hypothetical protein [Aquisphaera insulae]
MTFADKVLIRLADPATRDAVFDAVALEQFASAAYDTSRVAIQGPYSAVFEELRLGVAVGRRGVAEGQWGRLGSSEKSAAEFQVSGLGGTGVLVDAIWRGFIVARANAPVGRITSVTTSHADLAAIDREIVAALGALPSDPVALGQERRQRLVARLKAAVSEPPIVTDELVDRLLSTAGAAGVNEFFDVASRGAAFEPVRVTFSEGPPPPPPSPRPLPVAAAVLVRDAGFGLAQLLADSRAVRDQLEADALGRADDPALRSRQGVLVVWIVPAALFLDADWPGANPDARRKAAGDWLAREGIGLATAN